MSSTGFEIRMEKPDAASRYIAGPIALVMFVGVVVAFFKYLSQQ